MTGVEIKNIISVGENEKVEFKSDFNNDAVISISAFANTNGGILLVGIQNTGKITGIKINNEIVKDWLNQIRNKTSPPLFLDYKSISIDGKEIILFKIPEFPVKPVSVWGRYYKRSSSSNIQLSADEITEFRLVSLNYSFDSFSVVARFNELYLDAIQIFIQKIKNSGRFKSSKNIEFDLEKLGFLRKGKLTRAAELLWGNHNTAIHIGRFKSPDTIIDDVLIRAPLMSAVDESMEFIKKNIGLGYEFTGDLQRKNRWQFPLPVIRELLLNAVVYKDYRNPTDVIIKIFDGRIEFSNPGGLLGSLKAEDLFTDTYLAKHRNKLLAEAFYLTGEIEKYGTGFIRIRKSLIDYPELELKVIDFIDFLKVELVTKQDVGIDVGINVGINVGKEISEIQLQILSVIKENPKVTIGEIAKGIELTKRSVERNISQLKKMNYIERFGGRKFGYWKILKQ
jgi:ATP-dependent DNA helicase RecG